MGLEEWEKAPAVGGEAAKVVVAAASSRAAGVGPSQLLESTFPPALPNASALSLAGCSTSGVDSSRWQIMGSLGWRRCHWCRELGVWNLHHRRYRVSIVHTMRGQAYP